MSLEPAVNSPLVTKEPNYPKGPIFAKFYPILIYRYAENDSMPDFLQPLTKKYFSVFFINN